MDVFDLRGKKNQHMTLHYGSAKATLGKTSRVRLNFMVSVTVTPLSCRGVFTRPAFILMMLLPPGINQRELKVLCKLFTFKCHESAARGQRQVTDRWCPAWHARETGGVCLPFCSQENCTTLPFSILDYHLFQIVDTHKGIPVCTRAGLSFQGNTE